MDEFTETLPEKADHQSSTDSCPDSSLHSIDELPLSYLEMDAYGRVTRANRLTRLLHSVHSGELIGKMAWEAMPTDEQQQSCAAYMQALELGVDPPPVRRSVFTSHGEFRILELHRNLIRDQAGQGTGMRVLSVDVTEAQKTLEESCRNRQWFESVLTSIAEAVVITDALGFIRFLNPAAEALFAWSAGELVGKLIEKSFPVLSYTSKDPGNFILGKSLDKPTRGVAVILDRVRKEQRVEVSSSPILNKRGGYTEGVTILMRRVEAE